MPTVAEVTTRPLSGLNHIDALIGALPWNFIGRNTIYFSFALDAGGDASLYAPGTLAAFNAAQQAQVRSLLAYVAQVTGIAFTEVADASWADLHFANADLLNGYTSQDASHVGYTTVGNEAANLQIDAWVYLDNNDDAYDNANPQPGGSGYEALLHEIGHAIGLKHPDEGDQQLAAGTALGQDNSATTIMSETSVGGPYTTFNAYDIAVLQWLYGGDGIGGAYGASSPNRSIVGSYGADVLVGTAGADRLQGAGGNDTLDGGAGLDLAIYASPRGAYTIQHTSSGYTVTANAGTDGVDTLVNVERITFGDGSHVALDVTGNAGIAYRLYQAAFDRAPDLSGLGFQMNKLDLGFAVTGIAQNFIESPEFSSRYGALDNPQFVTQLYRNVLHREPDAQGLSDHLHDLEAGLPRSYMLVHFSESPENQANVIGAIQDGMAYAV